LSILIVVGISIAMMLFWQMFKGYEKDTKCDYCGRLNRNHDTHCPFRILEDD